MLLVIFTIHFISYLQGNRYSFQFLFENFFIVLTLRLWDQNLSPLPFHSMILNFNFYYFNVLAMLMSASCHLAKMLEMRNYSCLLEVRDKGKIVKQAHCMSQWIVMANWVFSSVRYQYVCLEHNVRLELTTLRWKPELRSRVSCVTD